MSHLPTLELHRYPGRVLMMAAAVAVAATADFVSKEIAVAANPETLLFNYVKAMSFSPHASLILVSIACSLLACVIPMRAVAIGAGVALGGALGNLASRPRWWDEYGGTPDFIPFADGSTGNVADIFIGVGAAAMLLGAVAWVALNAAGALRRGTF